MKQVVIDRYGAPEDVAACAEVPDVGAPAAGEVVFDVLAFPINPADLLTMQGIYPRLDASTQAIGNEAVGEIIAIGKDVEDWSLATG